MKLVGLVRWLALAGLGLAVVVMIGGQSFSQGDISPLETVVRGQSTWLCGGPVSLRVIVTNHNTGAPVSGSVRIGITPTDQRAEGERVVFTGQLRRGTLDASFPAPDLSPGQYELTLRVATPLGTDTVRRKVTLRRETQVLLTTDKPLYQPGQTIHLRTLALRRPSLAPAARERMTLEVEDAKGNKVFKQAQTLSEYGIASARFQLADEIVLGRYTVRAVMEEGTAERTVEVKRYVLPKFRVTVTTDRPYYLPGERLSGIVQCDYFFGKPVAGGQARVSLASFDVGFRDFAEIAGTTDDTGLFRFEADLPSYFVGQPLEQGNAFVKLEVEATDKAEHTEQVTHTTPIAASPALITVVPESGTLRPGLENIVYVLASFPDGRPIAGATVRVVPERGTEARGQTDAGGVFEARLTPAAGGARVTVYVARPDVRASREVELPAEGAPESLLLRADRALAQVGERVRFTVISTKQRGAAYVDVIRDRQTVLTRTVELAGGRADFELPLTQDLQGTLEVHAYQILPDENIIRDTRRLYLAPADDLVVEVQPDRESYRPGDPARLRFSVRDQRGRPTQAALGVTVVDESVFALQEMQPGLERAYFALERELLQPRYEVHGFTPEGIIGGRFPFAPPKPDAAETEAARQRAAAVLFAAASPREVHDLTVNTYQERLAQAMEGWVKEMARAAERIDRALQRYYQRHRVYLDPSEDISVLVRERLLNRADLHDRWGRPYRVRWRQASCSLDSAGPDGRWDTSDDLRGIGQWAKDGWRQGLRAGAAGVVRGGWAMADVPMLAAAKAALPAPVAAEPAQPAQPQVRLRQFFPETMYVNPAVITDAQGQAEVSLEMADSITTWRLQALASSQRGQLGSATHGLRVFQDFFVDIDLPVALTQNDEVSLPIAVYNYLPRAQTINLSLAQEPWFELVGDKPEQSLDIAASDIRVVYYRVRAKRIGRHALTVHARGSALSDAIRREVEVLPDGEERRDAWNDRLEGPVSRQVVIPEEAIPEASTILVKIYPGLFSQAVEGLDALLRMPFGCFEQTSSVTYPNVLVLDYLKTTRQAKPELQMKAEQYINVGYQRLLSFEVKGGGFSWFGDAPAHKVLTAYGLLEFRDMSRVHEVDENLITRTQQWLAGLQRKDGSWERDPGGIAEGIINRQTDELRVTAYLTWALAESGYRGEALARAFAYLDAHRAEVKDPYALAVIANAYLSGKPDAPQAEEAVAALAKLAVGDGQVAYWRSSGPTFTSAQNGAADLETTALATYALVKSGRQVELANKAITYLIRAKDSFGTWQTTQATVWALKALLLSLQRAAQEIDASVTVAVNGKQAASFRITAEDYDVVRQVDARELVRTGANDVRIGFQGKGSALYQIVARYYLPWELVRPPTQEPLSIDVDYDRTTLASDDIATATVRVVNNDPRACNMVVVDLGLPPGFEVMAEDLQRLVDGNTIQKFSLAARQIIIYLERLESRKPLTFSYRVRARFPLRAAAPASRVYRYYNPEIQATAKPVTVEVR